MKLNTQNKHRLQTIAAALFWVVVWQLASMAVAQVLFLPSPVLVLQTLWRLLPTGAFWRAVGTSLWRISLGFLLGLAAGCLLATASAAFRFVEVLLRPLMLLVRSTPVASFIILSLLVFGSRSLSTFISLLMVLPVIYNATYLGIQSADGKLLEMAAIFRVGFWRRLRAIYLPALLPSLTSAGVLALGMAWKSGVAAEVIGLPEGTIGERLYQAKIFLQMPDLFAWTLVIILLSAVFSKLVTVLLGRLGRRLVHTRPAMAAAGGPDAPAHPKADPPALALVHIYKAFGSQPVLCDFSAGFPAGGATALMGPSGSGKTTAARILMGLEPPDAGQVQAPSKTRFSCVFQEDRLCEGLNAVGNVALVLQKHRWDEVLPALAGLGLDGQLAQKPVAELSGGERRRVALVRALLAESGVLVLDEAFKGLDAATRQLAFEAIRQGLAGRTLVLITHDGAEAAAFGAVVVPVEKAE